MIVTSSQPGLFCVALDPGETVVVISRDCDTFKHCKTDYWKAVVTAQDAPVAKTEVKP